MQFLAKLVGIKKTDEQVKLIRFILRRFGYKPKKIHFFEQAVTHKSFSNTRKITSNERLEFLGDAVIDVVIAEFLYDRFPSGDEGYLTKLKSKLVNRKTLSEIGDAMEIRKILRYHNGRSVNLNTLEGNALEAIIGAIYLDGGYDEAKKALQKHILRKFININRILEEEIDFKSKLFIWSQRNKFKLDFQVVSEENLGQFWSYQIVAVINNRTYGMGKGASKKLAEQSAAKETLELVGII